MASVEQQKKMAEKRERLQRKHEKQEHLVNWYMINMCWGILAIILLKFVDNGYRSASTSNLMEPIMWTITGLLAVAAIVVFVLGRIGKIKNTKRSVNYTIFLGVCAVGSALVASYHRIRFALLGLIPAWEGVHSSWRVYWLMIAIVLYLIGALIYYFIKSHQIRKHG